MSTRLSSGSAIPTSISSSSAVPHGYQSQILLGMDLARRPYFPSCGGGHGLGYLLDTFVPRLRREGLGDVVSLLLEENPARAFSIGL